MSTFTQTTTPKISWTGNGFSKNHGNLQPLHKKLNPFLMKQIIFFCSVLFSTPAFSQSHEIALSLFSFDNYQSGNAYNIPEQNSQSLFRRVTPMLQYSFITKKKMELSIQYGYSYWNGRSSNVAQNESNTGRSEASFLQGSRTQSLRLGIGKRTSFQKYLFSSMLYLPAQLEYNTFYGQTYMTFDNMNTPTSKSNSVTTSPNTFYSGLYLAQSAYYPVLKNLYIGAEFNLGIKLVYRNGFKTETLDRNDVNGEVHTVYTTKGMMYRTSLDFIPALSVKYQFGCGKKK